MPLMSYVCLCFCLIAVVWARWLTWGLPETSALAEAWPLWLLACVLLFCGLRALSKEASR